MQAKPFPQKPEIVRVHTFIDGQNLFLSAKECFDYKYPNFDPIALSEKIANLLPNRRLEKVHFYTGIHDLRKDPFWHLFWNNKLLQLLHKGVDVHTRKLKYREIPIEISPGKFKKVSVGNEKGIDLRLALDLVRLARKGEYDVAIIFSQDQDLEEAVNEVYEIRQEFNRWIMIESAFPFSSSAKNPKGLSKTQWRYIDKSLYDECIDPRDYRP